MYRSHRYSHDTEVPDEGSRMVVPSWLVGDHPDIARDHDAATPQLLHPTNAQP
jgi:hypothetical protein